MIHKVLLAFNGEQEDNGTKRENTMAKHDPEKVLKDLEDYRIDDSTDWKQLALMAAASRELGQAELERVKRELEEARAELQWFRDKYGTEPERI